jgi:hypothetical protein
VGDAMSIHSSPATRPISSRSAIIIVVIRPHRSIVRSHRRVGPASGTADRSSQRPPAAIRNRHPAVDTTPRNLGLAPSPLKPNKHRTPTSAGNMHDTPEHRHPPSRIEITRTRDFELDH